MKKYFYSQHILSNKLRVLYLPIDTTGMVYVSLIGKVGRRAEKDNEIGAAHFLEHLFFDGTAKRPTALELNKFIDEQGSGHNGLTGIDTVEYMVRILSDKAEFAFDYLSDIISSSLLRDEDIEKERKVIAEEIAMRKDIPQDILDEQRQKLLYPGQAIGRTSLDEEVKLPNINKNILTEYRRRNYVTDNFILAVAGNIKKEKTLLLAEKYFDGLPSGEEAKFTEAKIEREQKVDIFKKDFKQAKFTISFRGYALSTPGFVGALVLARVLSGGFSSRLYECLRTKKHLIYSIHSRVVAFPDSGYFCISSSTGEEKLQEAISEIFTEIKKLLKEGVSDDELNKAKNISLFGFLSGMEGIATYTHSFSTQWLFKGKIKGVEERIKGIKSVTKEDLMETARYIFSDKPKILAITKSLNKLEVNF